jgi:hypothetical protein
LNTQEISNIFFYICKMLDYLHFLIAYSGLVLHVLIKMQKAKSKGNFKMVIFFDTNWLPTLINLIAIPIILLVITDTSLQDILPINHVTALLVGYQTQSMLKTITDIYQK